MAVCNLLLLLLLDEKAMLYNILLLFRGPLISEGLRRWPKWPIASSSTGDWYG